MVFVFSGTSEGRELCEKLAEKGVFCHVFVATEYGNAVMKQDEKLNVSVGRLNENEMREVIIDEQPDYVFDATHPHAVDVTENIKKACELAHCEEKYVRVKRRDDIFIDYKKAIVVSSTEEAVDEAKLFASSRKILLTTGVKELRKFCIEEIKDRLIVRVLPSIESIQAVYENDIPRKSVIAMEGPFSEEMNIATINKYDIGLMVTKNSGQRGGFSEKISACKATDIPVIVIDNPDASNSGVSVEEALNIAVSKEINNNVDFISINKENADYEATINNLDKTKVSLIGIGVCNEEYLLPKAYRAIIGAELIIGAKRMVEFGHKINNNASLVSEYMPEKVMEAIYNNKKKNVAVLFSGDTGFYSGTKGVYEKIKDAEFSVEIIPGVSSISYFASKLPIQYSDYKLISLHGKDEDYMEILDEGEGFIALCTSKEDIVRIVNSLDANGLTDKYNVHVGNNLGSDAEKILMYVNKNNIDDLTDGLFVAAVVSK